MSWSGIKVLKRFACWVFFDKGGDKEARTLHLTSFPINLVEGVSARKIP